MNDTARQLKQWYGNGSPAARDLADRPAERRAYYAAVVRCVCRHLIGDAADRLDDAPPDRPEASDWPIAPPQLDPARLAPGDLFRPLYEDLFPRRERHALGEYYTPEWLVDRVLDAAGFAPEPASTGDDAGTVARLVDPTCGSGAFLVRAIGRARAALGDTMAPADRLDLLRRSIVGLDLNPLAVLTARANWLIAVGDLLPSRGSGDIRPPVFQYDMLSDDPPPTMGHEEPAARSFDVVVGNPPWIAWDNLPEPVRRATLPLWRRYGLFTLDGTAARHGGAKKDLSMLVLYRAADRFLRNEGRLAMIVARSLLQTRGAGEGFRRLRLGEDGVPLGVERVDDYTALRPFRGAASQPAVIALRKGTPTRFPVPYHRFARDAASPDGLVRELLTARPTDPARPESAWSIEPAGSAPSRDARSENPSPCPAASVLSDSSGEPNRQTGSDYTAQLGANAAGANGVYWVELLGPADDGRIRVRNRAQHSRRALPTVEAAIEPGLIYPLLRWRDVAEYRAEPSAHVILPQDVDRRTGIPLDIMRRDYPATLAYLEQFEAPLRDRAAYRRYQSGGPFYSMYNVSRATLAPVKVVWRRMDRRLRAAVVEPVDDALLGRRPVVPQETCVLIPCATTDEAHYLCAMLNSQAVARHVEASSVVGGKGFGSPGILEMLNLPKFNADDPRHRELVQIGRERGR
jgi:hypothetical protein